MKKTPNKISTEDLLNALENGNTEETKAIDEVFNYRNDVPLFLQKYGIEAGEHKVSKVFMYRLYYHFSSSPVNKISFGITLSEFLANDRGNYLINIPRATFSNLVRKELQPGKNKYSPASISTRKHVERFIEQNGLVQGQKWLATRKLYLVYKKWCRRNKILIRFKDEQFATFVRLYFEYRRDNSARNYIKINPDIFLATQKEIELEQKEKQKIEQQIPSTGPELKSED